MSFLEIVERIIICLSPIIVAWFGFQANKNEKQTKKYFESQEALKAANDALKAKEKQELQAHFDKVDNAIKDLSNEVKNMQTSLSKLTEIDNMMTNLVTMSNNNFQYCTSLSTVISSIGHALESSDVIESGKIGEEIAAHEERERKLINNVCKITY